MGGTSQGKTMRALPKTKNKNVKLERRRRELEELKQLKDKVDAFVRNLF